MENPQDSIVVSWRLNPAGDEIIEQYRQRLTGQTLGVWEGYVKGIFIKDLTDIEKTKEDFVLGSDCPFKVEVREEACKEDEIIIVNMKNLRQTEDGFEWDFATEEDRQRFIDNQETNVIKLVNLGQG